ncbi:phage tail protein, P2 protein I family [Chromohalobacter canadensis]|uniref:Phage tail protein, P2 protein I family n=1 Tax=Chromohalobacter canadensis TaxID=141389 RepID=A0A285VTA9_9GAMM|nr:phage tail protein I [Chromohalobacter canadensis]SOC56466.1 phage tail protein, P2 protein I family [Chromohalobacter canadensis]
MTSLLPPNTTPLERRLSAVAADLERVSAPLQTLWDAQRIPANMLPWLAWAVGVDEWSRGWPEQTKRDAIDEAIPIRRLRGTVWAVRRALETLGYADVEILEHAQQDAKWRAAGGLYLDGSWLLDGSQTFLLEDAPRVVTTSWAQYALAFDIADAPFATADQRRLRARVESAAPLRSELIALIYRLSARWQARITLSAPRQVMRQRYVACRGARVHRARPLMGCWSLSGDYAPRLLDTAQRLGGDWPLTGKRPIGQALDAGWGTASIRLRQPLHVGMQASQREDWTLGETRPDRLDGKWALDENIDGHRALDGQWTFDINTLGRLNRPTLSGARTLGARHTLDSIGTTARAVLRDRRLTTEIRL